MEIGRLCGHLPNVRLVHADEHVLRLDVSVNDLTLGVQVVEALENLIKTNNTAPTSFLVYYLPAS